VLQLHAFQWFNHHLKGDDAPINAQAPSYFEPEQFKVFDELPSDEINTRVHNTFTRLAPMPQVPSTKEEWESQRSEWLTALREKCFRGWPSDEDQTNKPPVLRPAFEAQSGDFNLTAYDFDSQEHVSLQLFVLVPAAVPVAELESVAFHPLDAESWSAFLNAMPRDFAEHFADGTSSSSAGAEDAPSPQELVAGNRAVVYFAPRGIGATAWNANEPEKLTHIRRRFMLLGQTLDGMRVWDTRRAIQALRTLDGYSNLPLRIDTEGEMAGIGLYAALFEPGIAELDLSGLSSSHRDGPDILNVLRILDVPQAVALVAENSVVRIEQTDDSNRWQYPLAVAEKFGWKGRVEIQPAVASGQ
jgi:hypothetical protein